MALPPSLFPQRIATIDVGTNTALLLVADVGADGALTSVRVAERFVRLGEGVDATGYVTEAAMERLRTALLAYLAVARSCGAEHVLIGATSASRDARNRAELVDFVRRETGLRYEILSGEEEAALSFQGAVSAFDDLSGSCAVLDVGGGSTEIVVGEPDGGIRLRHSLDVGSVRLTERFFSQQPPASGEVGRAERLIHRVLGDAGVVLDPGRPLIGAAGTAVALALVHRGASSWPDLGAPHVTLGARAIRGWRERLLAMPYEAVMGLNPAVMEGRADVFPAGVLILETVMRRFGLPACRVSPRSLRCGLALRLAQQLRRDGQAT